MEPNYTYKGKVIRVIDGDTFEILIDLGFHVHTLQSIRLEGINTPELTTQRGKEAKAYMQTVFSLYGNDVVIRTKKTFAMTFARYVGHIELPDGETVAEKLIDAGYVR